MGRVGHVNVLEWAVRNDVAEGWLSAIYGALQGGHVDALEWIHQLYHDTVLDDVKQQNRLATFVVKYGANSQGAELDWMVAHDFYDIDYDRMWEYAHRYFFAQPPQTTVSVMDWPLAHGHRRPRHVKQPIVDRSTPSISTTSLAS